MNDDDLHRGEAGEDLVHNFMGTWYNISYVTGGEQRKGVDALYTNKETGEQFTVEVKTDEVAGTTGNAFIEVISVDYPTKPGWAWTCKADKLLYWLPRQRRLLILAPISIQAHIRDWARQYGIKAVPNDGYQTYGVAVPLSSVEAVADRTLPVP